MMTRVSLALALGSAFTNLAFAEEGTFKLNELTCFEVQSLSEDDSLFLTGMLIGHVMGDDAMTADAIKTAVEAMDAICGENPDMLAIDALS